MLFPPGRSPQGRVPAAGGALAVRSTFPTLPYPAIGSLTDLRHPAHQVETALGDGRVPQARARRPEPRAAGARRGSMSVQ